MSFVCLFVFGDRVSLFPWLSVILGYSGTHSVYQADLGLTESVWQHKNDYTQLCSDNANLCKLSKDER